MSYHQFCKYKTWYIFKRKKNTVMFCFSVYKYLFGNRFPLIVHYHLIIQISSGLDIPGRFERQMWPWNALLVSINVFHKSVRECQFCLQILPASSFYSLTADNGHDCEVQRETRQGQTLQTSSQHSPHLYLLRKPRINFLILFFTLKTLSGSPLLTGRVAITTSLKI